MSVDVNVDAARRFLEWYFSEAGSAKVGLSFQRIDPDKARAAAKKNDSTNRVFPSVDAALASKIWAEKSPDHKVFYGTSPLFRQEGNSITGANSAMLPAFWVDVDGLRDLNIDGDEYWSELRETEEASCWVRTSSQGIQAIFKLDAPIVFEEADEWSDEDDPDYLSTLDEDELEMRASVSRKVKPNKLDRASRKAEIFREEIKPLLWNICYYFGGDERAISFARLLRVPGTLNIKYNPPYRAKGVPTDTLYTLADLRKRFPEDATRVPRLVFHAIVRQMQKHCAPGNNHFPLLALWGTVRKYGMDKASCHALRKDITKFLNTGDDESASVESTYDADMEVVASLHGETNGETYEDIVEPVVEAIKFWIKLKTKYTKALKIDWAPDRGHNPLAEIEDDSLFFVKNGELYWNNPNPKKNEPGTTKIANFSVRTLYKIIKQDEVSGEIREIDYACLTFNGHDYTFEWPSEKDTDFSKFKTLPGLPPKVAFMQRDLWTHYMGWLNQQAVTKRMIEKKSYGVVDFEKGKPTLLLPKPHTHPEYVLTRSTFDTASPTLVFEWVKKEDRAAYLQNFAKAYPTYHNPHYIWPALGWFASTVFQEIAFHTLDGFPVLLVWGLAGSGKTTLVKNVLVNHYGCLGLRDFRTTTAYSQRKVLSSNNIIPLVIDEFKDSDENKTAAIQGQVNILFNRNYREAAGADGQSSIDKLIGSMCMLGEHPYQDEAAMQRTYTIKVGLDYLQELRLMDDTARAKLAKRQHWLESPKFQGTMLNIQLEWMESNYERIAEIYTKAQARVEAKSQKDIPMRVITGRAIVLGGLMCLSEVYKDNGVDFPLTQKQMLTLVLEGAAEANNNSDNYGSNVLKVMWQETDFIIMDALRHSASLAGNMYVFDPKHGDEIIYFSINRWYQYLKPRIKASSAATLTNLGAFRDLLLATSHNEDSPILEYPCENPVLGPGVCKCSLSRIRDQFQINPKNWQFLDHQEND